MSFWTRRKVHAALCAGVVGVTAVFGGSAAQAVSPLPSPAREDAAARSEALDVPTGRRAANGAAAQVEIARALDFYQRIPGLSAAEKAAAHAEFGRLPLAARAAAARTSTTASANAAPSRASEQASALAVSSATMAVPHVSQEKSNYCGPASAYMVLKYMGRSKSASGGTALSQKALAGSTYLKTDANGATTWSSGAMASGMNKWLGYNAYSQVTAPSATTTKAAIVSATMVVTPLVADTVEFAGGQHYNGHPNRTIGHWIVNYGYTGYGATSYWKDPATSFYTNAKASFSYDTASFANRFLQSNGIAY